MGDFDEFDDKDLFLDMFDLLEDIKFVGYDLRKLKFFNIFIEKIFDFLFFIWNRNWICGELLILRFLKFLLNLLKKLILIIEFLEIDFGDEIFNLKFFWRLDLIYFMFSYDIISFGEMVLDVLLIWSNLRKVNIIW